MKFKREVAFAVKIGKGFFQQNLFARLIQIGVEEDIDHRLQPLVGQFFLLHKVQDGIVLLKIRMGNAFNITLAFLLVAAMIVGSIYLLNKKDDNSGNPFF